MPYVCIIGAGKVGHSLYYALRRNHIESTLIDRSTLDLKNRVAQSELTLITTQDSKIESTCEQISPWVTEGSTVAHCSGALNSQILESAAKHGAFTGCAHPLNTFPSMEIARELLTKNNHDTYCYLSGHSNALTLLEKTFSAIGFHVSYINDKSKAAYHAACVFLCNYLTSISETGLQIAESAGLDRDEFWNAVKPLIEATLNNISDHGTAASLSGPIVRGDLSTISVHLSALNSAPEIISKTYKVLGQQAANLAQKSGNIDKQTAEQIRSLLDD